MKRTTRNDRLEELDAAAQVGRAVFRGRNEVGHPWDELPPRVRQIWREVALAVIETARADGTLHNSPHRDEEAP